ncbi:hypothetical protein BDY21DRAFT_340638 [Lineolata rhizophorae]|uniref:Uncharacterized protein n=1 Tax=Lineolata rhizophorae TaxID=578093 RepID=A0A6A6P3I6_9PEZI|nr:hypothetical protein BDY21DRAFT_340638 [Lineolata rhizophorae]
MALAPRLRPRRLQLPSRAAIDQLLYIFWILPGSTTAQQSLPTTLQPAAPSMSAVSFDGPTSPRTSLPPSSSDMPSSSTAASNRSPTLSIVPVFTVPVFTDQVAADRQDPEETRSGLLNYYFVFLAVFVILLFVLMWLVHRRKKKLKLYIRSHQQNALARDIDGWVSNRRWMHGNWRSGGQGAGVLRRHEGLNEHGEAPPPYQPSAPAENTVGAGDGTNGWPGGPPQSAPHDSHARDPETGLAIPLRTLSREGGATLKPPDYNETVRSTSAGESVHPLGSSQTSEDPLQDLQRPSHR